MYTYSDQWDDESGNLVVLNYTDADPCGDYSVYSDIEVQMPSGYYQSASASGDCCAQATVLGPLEPGGTVANGRNQVDYECASFSAVSIWDITIAIAMTKVKNVGSNDAGFCPVVAACSNTSTPMCTYSWIYVGSKGTCWPAWDVESLAWRVNGGPRHCWINVAIRNRSSSPSPNCTPEN